jgi:hypothetical protein
MEQNHNPKVEHFSFRQGRFVTCKRAVRPEYYRLRRFLEAVRERTDIMQRYGLHLMGGVLFDFRTTWDVDICLTGPIESPERLEDDLDALFDLGFNHFEILLDLLWFEAPPPEVGYDEVRSPDFVQHRMKFRKTTCTVVEMGDQVRSSDLRETERFQRGEIRQLTEYLVEGWLSEYPGTSGKFIDRILANPQRRLKTSFPVEIFLREDELYFLRHTNRGVTKPSS